MQRAIPHGSSRPSKLTRKMKSRATLPKTQRQASRKRKLLTLTALTASYSTFEPPPRLKPLPTRHNPNPALVPTPTSSTTPIAVSDSPKPITQNLPLFIDKDLLYKTNDSPEFAYNTLHKFSYDIIPNVLGATPNPQINSRHPYLNLYLYTSPQQWQHYLDKTIVLDSPWMCFAKELESQQRKQRTEEGGDNATEPTSSPAASKSDLFSYDLSLTAPLLSQVTLMTNLHTIDKETPSHHNQMGDIAQHRQINSIKKTAFAMPIMLNTDNYDLYRNYHLKHFHHAINGNYNVKHSRIFNPRYITTLLPNPTPFELPSAIQRRIDKNLIYIDSTLETFVSNPIESGSTSTSNDQAADGDSSARIDHKHEAKRPKSKSATDDNNNNNKGSSGDGDGNVEENATGEELHEIPKLERFQLGNSIATKLDPVHDQGHNRSYDVKHNIKITVPLWFHQKSFLPLYVPERLRVAQELTIGQYHDEYLQYKYDDFGDDDVVGNTEINQDGSQQQTPAQSPKQSKITSSRPKFIPHDEYYYDKELKSYLPLDKASLQTSADVIYNNVLKFATIPATADPSNRFNTRQVTYQFQLDEEYYPEFQSKPTWEGLGIVQVANGGEWSDGEVRTDVFTTPKTTHSSASFTALNSNNDDGREPVYLPPGFFPDAVAVSGKQQQQKGGMGHQTTLLEIEDKINHHLPHHPQPHTTTPSPVATRSNTKSSPISTQDYHVFFSALSKALYNVPDNENFVPENDIFSITLPSIPSLTSVQDSIPVSGLTGPLVAQSGTGSDASNNNNDSTNLVGSTTSTAASATVAPVEDKNRIRLMKPNEKNIWKIIANVDRNRTSAASVEDGNQQNIRLFSDWFNHIVRRDDLSFIKSTEFVPKIDIERF